MLRKLTLLSALALAAACSGSGAKASDTAAAAGVAPTATANDPAAVRAAIDAANKSAMDGANAGRIDGMMANYADDAVVMMPGMKAMSGKAAIEAGLNGMFSSMDIKNFRATTTDVMVSGDLAVETGSLMLDAGPKGGKLTTDSIKYVTVWKKQADGSWKVVRDINNTDIAPKM